MQRLTQFLREELERLPALGGLLSFTLRPLADLHALLEDPDSQIPAPWAVRRKDGGVLHANPVMEGGWGGSLRMALRSYLREEAAHLEAAGSGEDEAQRRGYLRARSALSKELERCLEHCSFSSHGRLLSSVLWLLLSRWTSQELGRDPSNGGETADARYRLFGRLSGLLHDVSLEVNRRIAGEVGGSKGEFLSTVLLPMRENVLVFTEESIDPGLGRLAAYLRGPMEIDPERFLQKVERTREFARSLVRKDPVVREAVRALYDTDPDELDLERAFFDGRLLELVVRHRKYNPRKCMSKKEAGQFRELSRRLRLFDLLHLLRRRVLRVRERDGELLARIGGKNVPIERESQLLDFSLPGVMENVVYRHGMLYDIRDFSATLQAVRRQGPQREKQALRHMFVFHQLLYELEKAQHLSMEKFLGDGAFYTGPSCRKLLQAAVRLRDLYVTLKGRGLVFDRGIRIALNYNYYNLLPIRSSSAEGGYFLEFHGPGLVELSRLMTGKTGKELREIKEELVARGYNPSTVQSFFEPMERAERQQPEEAQRGPYIDRHGTLVNEGIVASRTFVEKLSGELEQGASFREVTLRGHRFVTVPFGTGSVLGIRELGMAKLKGLEPQQLYAVDAGSELDVTEEREAEAGTLVEALDMGYGRPRREERSAG